MQGTEQSKDASDNAPFECDAVKPVNRELGEPVRCLERHTFAGEAVGMLLVPYPMYRAFARQARRDTEGPTLT